MIDTTPAPPEKEEQKFSKRFVDRITGLQKSDKGKLAVLKRNAGVSLSDARGVSWFYEIVNQHGIKPYEEEAFFLVATLLASDKAALEGNAHFTGNLGASMRRLDQETQSDSVQRRFGLLLDAEFDPGGGGEMAFRLRQTVKLLLSKKVAICWAKLLDDLLAWERPGKRVRKKWAHKFYAAPDTAESAGPVGPDGRD